MSEKGSGKEVEWVRENDRYREKKIGGNMREREGERERERERERESRERQIEHKSTDSENGKRK